MNVVIKRQLQGNDDVARFHCSQVSNHQWIQSLCSSGLTSVQPCSQFSRHLRLHDLLCSQCCGPGEIHCHRQHHSGNQRAWDWDRAGAGAAGAHWQKVSKSTSYALNVSQKSIKPEFLIYHQVKLIVLFCLFDRFVAISDLYEPTDDGTESQVRENQISTMLIVCLVVEWLNGNVIQCGLDWSTSRAFKWIAIKVLYRHS